MTGKAPYKSLGNYAVIARIYYLNGIRTSANFIIPVFLAPFIYNFLVDYVALIATRYILDCISGARNVLLIVMLFILAILAIVIIADIGFTLAMTAFAPLFGFPELFSVGELIRRIAFPLYNLYPGRLGEWTVHTITGVFLGSTLIGIIWIGIFSVAVIVANLIMKIRGLGPWIKEEFQVQRQPFKIMGGLLVIFLGGICVIVHLISVI